jgi:hypothetical protein
MSKINSSNITELGRSATLSAYENALGRRDWRFALRSFGRRFVLSPFDARSRDEPVTGFFRDADARHRTNT